MVRGFCAYNTIYWSMPNPLIGCSGPHPWEYPAINEFLKTLNATYSCPHVDYNWWVNGTDNKGWKGGDGPAFYDDVYNLHKAYKMIMGFGPIPPQKLEEFVQMIAHRYPEVWAFSPLLENGDAIETDRIIKAFRAALPNARLVGPNLYTSHHPAYMDELVRLGTLGCLDILAMHDYMGCPGRGTAPTKPWGEYGHPTQVLDYGHTPDLMGRIEWLRSYVKYTRNVFPDDPKIMYTEFGIYSGDINDAKLAAVISRLTEVPFILSTPNSPVGITPFSNGVYGPNVGGVFTTNWSPPVQEYLKTMDLPLSEIKNLLPPAPVLPVVTSKKRTAWQQLMFKLFGLYKK